VGKAKARPSKRKMQRLHYGREWPEVRRTFFNEIEPIVKTLRNPRLKTRTRESLQNYLVMRLVSMTDYYFTNIVRRLVDERKLDASKLFKEKSLQEEVNNAKYTEAQIVATHFNYSNYDDIQKVLSELLRFDFMAKIIELDRIYNFTYIKGGILLHENWDEFRKIFDLRDDIAHEMKDSNLSKEQVLSLADNTMIFLDAASWICHPEFNPKIADRVIRV
jgi:hypothetical protein